MRVWLAQARLQAEIAAWRHGLLWPLVCLCLVLAGGAWFGLVQTQRATLEALTQRLAVQTQRQQSTPRAIQTLDAQAQAWQRVRGAWPPSSAVDTHIASLLQMAQKHGLVIEQADYQYRVESELNALKATMNLPLRGSYANLRRWIDAALLEHPNLALAELSIKREAVTAAEPEVKARWVAWYRADGTQADNAITAIPGATGRIMPAAVNTVAVGAAL